MPVGVLVCVTLLFGSSFARVQKNVLQSRSLFPGNFFALSRSGPTLVDAHTQASHTQATAFLPGPERVVAGVFLNALFGPLSEPR